MTIEISYTDGRPTKKLTGSEAEAQLFEELLSNTLEVVDNSHLKATAREGSQDQRRAYLEDLAKEWQRSQATLSTSYEELALWSSFFEKYGEELGLLEDFRENGII